MNEGRMHWEALHGQWHNFLCIFGVHLPHTPIPNHWVSCTPKSVLRINGTPNRNRDTEMHLHETLVHFRVLSSKYTKYYVSDYQPITVCIVNTHSGITHNSEVNPAPFTLSLKVRSHQTRMKHYARMIYMLSQCKDAIDNPVALFAWIMRRKLSVWGVWRAIRASWKFLTLADIRAAITNQELALAVTWLRAEAENPKQQWRTN